MKTLRPLQIALTLVAGLALAGCGSTVYRDVSQNSGGSTWDDGTAEVTNFVPFFTKSLALSGTNAYTSGVVNTDDHIAAMITIASAGFNGTSGASSQYDCASFLVTLVNGTTGQPIGASVSTGLLSASPGTPNCPKAPDHKIIDFSKKIIPGYAPALKIKVQAEVTDAKFKSCINNPCNYNLGTLYVSPYSGTYSCYPDYSRLPQGCNAYNMTPPILQYTTRGTLEIEINH